MIDRIQLYELRFSEDVAFRYAGAARLVREFPRLLEFLARGELHLTGATVRRYHRAIALGLARPYGSLIAGTRHVRDTGDRYVIDRNR